MKIRVIASLLSLFLVALLVPAKTFAQAENPWPMVAANPQRTSYSPENLTSLHGSMRVEWYRPIEAYIPPYSHVIAANNLIYVSTAKGLFALYLTDSDGTGPLREGDTAWRYDTQLPLGNSPTIFENTVYVGGFDKKIHVLNATTGAHLWSYDGAMAGYSANPLVIRDSYTNNQPVILVGNRDGYFYAMGGQGHTTRQGQLLWRYQATGPIYQSAAYKDGAVYFPSNDGYAYALYVNNGSQKWGVVQLPSDGFHAYWPVIYTDPVANVDRVIFTASVIDRQDDDPGDANKSGDVFWNDTSDYILGDPVTDPAILNEPWVQGRTVRDFANVSEFYENNPDNDPVKHKPWQRAWFVLNADNGTEFTTRIDGDNYPEYAPIATLYTRSGQFYPPAIGTDNMPYTTNRYWVNPGIVSAGRVLAWRMGTRYVKVLSQLASMAEDEPNAVSASFNTVYRAMALDRSADWMSINASGAGGFWGYGSSQGFLDNQAPGYDEMWYNTGTLDRLHGNFGYKTTDPNHTYPNMTYLNGIYNGHGYPNPLIPYRGKLISHRSNTIVVYGTGTSRGKVSLLKINSQATDAVSLPSVDTLKQRLDNEIQKIITAGHLKPGYYNQGQFVHGYRELKNYFTSPSETLLTLAAAEPYVNSTLLPQLRTYLHNEFTTYYNPPNGLIYDEIGWADGVSREGWAIPPEVLSRYAAFPKRETAYFSPGWQYHPLGPYALYKFAQAIRTTYPNDVTAAYSVAKRMVNSFNDSSISESTFTQYPYRRNAYISGYIGFLYLQKLVYNLTPQQTCTALPSSEQAICTQALNRLNALLTAKVNNFSKDTPFTNIDSDHTRSLNIARNFLWMVPEYYAELQSRNLLTTHQNQVNQALTEYNFLGAYWLAPGFEAIVDEGAQQHLYDSPALFQAKAWVLDQKREELYKYLDAPVFARGDLYYLQNLVATIKASASGPEPSPSPTPPPATDLDGDGDTDVRDLLQFLGFFGGTGQGDFNNSGRVDVFDFGILVGSFG